MPKTSRSPERRPTEEIPEIKKGGQQVVFSTTQEAQAYKAWKQSVPKEARVLVESTMLEQEVSVKETGLPRVDAFFSSLAHQLKTIQEEAVPPADTPFADFFTRLRSVTTNEGPADALQLLRAQNVPFTTKLAIWQRHIAPMLEYLREQDLSPPAPDETPSPPPSVETGYSPSPHADHESAAPTDDLPPPESEEMAPSMDEMAEQKEQGESRAQFTVHPYFGGYYRQNLMGEWAEEKLVWRPVAHEESPLAVSMIDPLASRLLSGRVRGKQTISIPLPYGWALDRDSFETSVPPQAVSLAEDQFGNVRLTIESDGVYSYSLKIGKKVNGISVSSQPTNHESATTSRLPAEMVQKVQELQTTKLSTSNRACLLIKTVRDHLEYSNDSSMNAVYRADPAAYVEKIWQEKKADCDVANTVAAVVLRSAGISCRLATGHYVKASSEKGQALLTSGTGHAWLEVFDADTGRWFRADATPKGDPAMDDDRPDEQPPQQNEGDFGEQEAEIMSDEELEKLIEVLAKAEGGGEEKSKTGEQRLQEDFAAQAGTTVERAREVLEMFRRVREMRDEKGKRIQEELIRAWKQLVQSRAGKKREYEGPVRMSEGDALEDPVVARVEQRAGVRDVSGFEKLVVREKPLKLFGGLDVYLAVDLSGSMAETVNGRVKAELQRDAVMLYVDSLMQCADVSRKAGTRLAAPAPIRIQIVSFHGGISVDLPLTGEWGPKEKVALYEALVRTAGGGTPDHEALLAIGRTIRKQREGWRNQVHKKGEHPPLEFAAVFLDGGSYSPQAVAAALHALREEGTLVYGYGMTAAGKPVKATYAPHATVVEDLNGLAAAVAEDTISVFKKLHPERIK